MAFEDQTLGGFMQARIAATELLLAEGVKDRMLSFEETLVMQAASHILSQRDQFYGREIMHIIQNTTPGFLYPVLGRFEEVYGITASEFEVIDHKQVKRPARRLYAATEFGSKVFNLFKPEE